MSQHRYAAQLVMRHEDGGSILSSGPVTAATMSGAALPDERVSEIRGRVEALGFAVEAGDATTLSITGPRERFAEVFGLEADPARAAAGAHATRLPEGLTGYVADVFVPQAPTAFP